MGQWSVRLLIAAALGAIALYIGGLVPLVVATATIGIILAATFRPATRILEKRGMKSGRAALVVTLGLYTTITVLVVMALASLIANAADVTRASDSAVASMTDQEWLQTLAGLVGSSVLQSLAAVVSALAGLVVVFLLGALLTFYLLRDGGRGWAVVLQRFGGWRRDTVDQAGQRAITILGNYMIGTGALSAFGAASTAVIMFVLGLPLIMPVAALAFILGFIPYIGSALGTLLAFMIAVQSGTTQDIVIMLVWVVVFNIVQGSVIAPIVYGKAVSLHPAIVLIAIPAGGQLAGVLGMFLGVPILGIVATVWRSVLAVMSDRDTAIEIQGGNGPPGFGSIDPAPPEPASLDTGPPPDPSPG
jgi:predicted PurR-regulated permease PerM